METPEDVLPLFRTVWLVTSSWAWGERINLNTILLEKIRGSVPTYLIF